MAVNKVEINGEVKLDLTQDTVSADTLLQGVTAHDAAGNPVVGEVVITPVSTVVVTLKPTSISGQIMTLDNAAFDWTKYKLAGYFITSGTASGGYRAYVYATETKKANNIAYKGIWDTQYSYVEFTITENTTVSGRLTIYAVYTGASSQPGWGLQNTSAFECTVILKTK